MSILGCRGLGLSVLITALSGCAILSGPSLQDAYRLPPTTLTAADRGSVDLSLSILRPHASGALASPRIVVIPHDHRISAYGGSRWSSPAPVLWRDYVLDAFQKDGRIERLSGDNEDVSADWELGGVLRSFHVEYQAGEPRVMIEFDARLIEVESREIAASRHFVVTQGVDGEQVPQVVEAFGRAADTMARQLTEWTVQQLS